MSNLTFTTTEDLCEQVKNLLSTDPVGDVSPIIEVQIKIIRLDSEEEVTYVQG